MTLNFLNALFFFLLVAGHTEVLVAFVNRSHALPYSCETLHRWRRLHDILIPLFPILLVVWPGLWFPALLWADGGEWAQLATGWKIYLSICAAGTIGLAWRMFQWHTRRPPQSLTACKTEVHNITALAETSLVGNGPHARMSLAPGNEQFHLEINDKTFQCPTLPAAWSAGSGLRVLHISDLHFIGSPNKAYYQHCLELVARREVDIVLFTGDLMDDNNLMHWIPDTLGQLQAPLGCHYILGNHDWNHDASAVRDALNQIGWNDVSGRTTIVQHQGVDVVLGGSERPWMGTHPDFNETSDGVRIFLCHSPDYIGWARRHGVSIMLSGHNHGGQVILPIIGPVYSPSLYGVKFSHGDFQYDDTLLCISRGVSGRHPLRWNCLPEINTLTFEGVPTGNT